MWPWDNLRRWLVWGTPQLTPKKIVYKPSCCCFFLICHRFLVFGGAHHRGLNLGLLEVLLHHQVQVVHKSPGEVWDHDWWRFLKIQRKTHPLNHPHMGGSICLFSQLTNQVSGAPILRHSHIPIIRGTVQISLVFNVFVCIVFVVVFNVFLLDLQIGDNNYHNHDYNSINDINNEHIRDHINKQTDRQTGKQSSKQSSKQANKQTQT